MAYLPQDMEWHKRHAPLKRAIHHCIRRVRGVGLWSNVRQSVVSTPMAGGWSTVAIAPKELVPIVMAVILWGPYWAGKRVRCLCDNISVVAAVNKGAARDPALSSLLRTLAFVTAVLDISLTARHLPGVQNTSADALSRDKLPLFFSLNPQASPIPAIIPQELRKLVLNTSLHWTSPGWTRLLSTSWVAALRLPPAQHTNPPNAAM